MRMLLLLFLALCLVRTDAIHRITRSIKRANQLQQNEVDVHAITQHQLALDSAIRVSGSPPIATLLAAMPATLNLALTAAGAGAGPVVAAFTGATIVPAAAATGTFTYTREAAATLRVVRAEGVVVLGGVTNIGGATSAPNVICDAMFYHSIVSGAAPGIVRPANWHSGHMIGAAIGGSNVQPLNFFPQEVGSNSIGRYWRMERIAQAAATVIAGTVVGGAACTVSVRINYNYAANQQIVESAPPVPNAIVRTTRAVSWIPTHGTYSLIMSQACGAAYAGMAVGGLPNVYAKVMHKHIIPANLAGGFYTFTHNWENGFDKADPIIDDELFWP